jgi:hypothetical protein
MSWCQAFVNRVWAGYFTQLARFVVGVLGCRCGGADCLPPLPAVAGGAAVAGMKKAGAG